MSSIMRARSALMGRGEGAEVIGGSSRAEGCWTFNARDRMPRSSPLTAHPLTATRGIPRERVRSMPLLRPLYRHRRMAGMGTAADLPGVARIRPYRLLPISVPARRPIVVNCTGQQTQAPAGCHSAGKGRKRMAKLTRRSLLRNSFSLVAAGTLARPYIANAAATTAAVWWVQGFAQEEDVSFKKIVADYEKA